MDAGDLHIAPFVGMVQDIERRKGRRSSGALVAIGALIILDDGSECIVAGYDQNGNVLCYPVSQ